jgi:adenylate cyclase
VVPDPVRTSENEEHWREFLTRGDSMMHVGRRVFTHLPSDPRCRLCTAPFSGFGGSLMRVIGQEAVVRQSERVHIVRERSDSPSRRS